MSGTAGIPGVPAGEDVKFTILFMKSSGRAESWIWYVVAAVATVGSFYFWSTGSSDR